MVIRLDGAIRVTDDGRGIPVDIHPTEGIPAVEVVLSKIHAGGKFDKDSYKVPGGLHGVGVSCVNALSEWLEVDVHQAGKVHSMRFERGNKVVELRQVGDSDHRGTVVTFKPDSQIFTTTEFEYGLVQKRLRETAYLMGSSGLSISLEDERTGQKDSFEFPEGLRTFVAHINKNKEPLHPEVVHFVRDAASPEIPDLEYRVELALGIVRSI